MKHIEIYQIATKEGIRRTFQHVNTPPSPPPIIDNQMVPCFRIFLHGLYIGHDFEGPLGGSGEFYWYSTVSDGNEIHIQDSRVAKKFGKNGILTNVDEKTWLPLDMIELFHSKFLKPKHDHITFAFTLMESDNGDEAKNLFKTIGTSAGRVVKILGGGDIGTKLADEAVKLFSDAIDVNDDDHAIQAIKGLNELNYYSVGKFIRLEGKRHDNRPTFAICSIVPLNAISKDHFYFQEEKNININTLEGVTRAFDIPQDGTLSVFIRVRHSYKYGVRLIAPNGKGLTGLKWTIVKNIPVKKGTYPLKVQGLTANSTVDLQVIYTSNQYRESLG